MAIVACQIDGRAHYNGAWQTTEFVGIDSNYENGYIGREGDGYNRRSVYRIKIPKINGSTTNKKISATISIQRGSVANGRFIATFTKTAPNFSSYKDYKIPDDHLGEATVEFSATDYSAHPITFNAQINDQDNSEHYIYMWVVNDIVGNWIAYKSGYSDINYSASLEYQQYTAPTSPNILSNNKIVTPSESIVVSWEGGKSGINVSIKNFILTIRKNSSTGTILYSKNDIKATETSIKIPISDFSIAPSRGDILYATIQAIGAVSGYNGKINSNKVGGINTLPLKPTIEQDGTIVDLNKTINFTVVAGKDSDNQECSVWYKINNNTELKRITSQSLIINLDFSQNLPTNNTIYFYTYDGLEYSSDFTSKSFIVNYIPEISKITQVHTYVEDMGGGNNSLVSKTNITFSLNGGNAENITLYCRAAPASKDLASAEVKEIKSGYSYNQSTKTITISINNISYINAGNYFQFSFKVHNGELSSEQSNWLESGRKSNIPEVKVTEYFSILEKDEKIFFGETIGFKYQVYPTTKPEETRELSSYAKVESLIVKATTNNSYANYNCEKSNSANWTRILTLSSWVDFNEEVTLNFRIKNVAGQEALIDIGTFTRAKFFEWGSNPVIVDDADIRYYSNERTFNFSYPIAEPGNDRITYNYNLIYLNKEISITDIAEKYEQITEDYSSITVAIPWGNIKEKFWELVDGIDPNAKVNFTLKIIASDSFYNQEKEDTFIVNFMDVPKFAEGIKPRIKLNLKNEEFSENDEQANQNIGIEIFETDKSEVVDKRLFNAGEKIIFILPKAEDANNDIKEYEILLSRNDFVEQDGKYPIKQISEVTFSSWKKISKQELNSFDENYYYYQHTASQFTKNEYIYYKIKAIDSKGNSSVELFCPSYIIGCRTALPKFSIDMTEIGRNEDEDVLSITYKLNIIDLGGSAPSENGWDKEFYNLYPNFERDIVNDRKENLYKDDSRLILEIELASDANFQDFLHEPLTQELKPNEGEGLLDFDGESIKKTIELNSTPSKIFIRFKLKIGYGFNGQSSIISEPWTYTYFGMVPTVSHRPHMVGINNNIFNDDEVLVINNYQNKKKVVLYGIHELSENTIVIDLTTGQIDGLIISGGSW